MKYLLVSICALAAQLSALPQPNQPPQPQQEPLSTRPLPTNAPRVNREDELPPPPIRVTFTIPGIIGLKEGQWRGTDHLLNLTDNIRIAADVYASSGVNLPFTAENLEELATNLFVKSALKPSEPSEYGKPPLPYMHFLVMVHRAENEYAVFIQARLFEKVKLSRVALPKEVTFQAITWEDEKFLMVPPNRLKPEVYDQVQEMTKGFIARYNFFEKQENRIRGR